MRIMSSINGQLLFELECGKGEIALTPSEVRNMFQFFATHRVGAEFVIRRCGSLIPASSVIGNGVLHVEQTNAEHVETQRKDEDGQDEH